MWLLLRDQIERSRWLILVSAVVAGMAALLGPVLGPLRAEASPNDAGRLFARLFITTFATFVAASMGHFGTLADSRYGQARAARILPLGRPALARALWLGAALPGVIIASLVCVLVALAHIVLNRNASLGSLFDSLVPTILAGMLGSALSVIFWSYLSVTRRLPETIRQIVGVVLFHQLWYLVWLGLATQSGLLGVESMSIVLLAAVVAGSCVLLAPRLWGDVTRRPRPSSRDGHRVGLDLRQGDGRESSLIGLAVRASAHAFGFAFLVNAGFLTAMLAHRPLERYFSLPFRLRWMVLVVYAVAWVWFSAWRPSLRTLRCLPVTGRNLVIATIGACSMIYLAGSAGILAALALEQGQAGLSLGELPFVVLLAFGSSLCLAGMALHVQRPNGLHQLFGFGFFVLPNAMFLPIALGDGIWLAGFTWRTWLWSYSGPAAVFLAVVGVVAISRGLTLSGAPYRPAPLVDRAL
jgi:hypothetical protein